MSRVVVDVVVAELLVVALSILFWVTGKESNQDPAFVEVALQVGIAAGVLAAGAGTFAGILGRRRRWLGTAAAVAFAVVSSAAGWYFIYVAHGIGCAFGNVDADCYPPPDDKLAVVVGLHIAVCVFALTLVAVRRWRAATDVAP